MICEECGIEFHGPEHQKLCYLCWKTFDNKGENLEDIKLDQEPQPTYQERKVDFNMLLVESLKHTSTDELIEMEKTFKKTLRKIRNEIKKRM